MIFLIYICKCKDPAVMTAGSFCVIEATLSDLFCVKFLNIVQTGSHIAKSASVIASAHIDSITTTALGTMTGS